MKNKHFPCSKVVCFFKKNDLCVKFGLCELWELKVRAKYFSFSIFIITIKTNPIIMGLNHPTVLVAGGAGFIGSNLCHSLVSEGKRVLCIDNFLTGSIANISSLMNHPNFQFVRHDVIYPFQCEENASFSAIYNFACPASPKHYQKNPIHTTQTCVMGTLNLLSLARKHQCTLLQSSTSEVYGDPDVAHHPQREDYRGNVSCNGIRSCYDEGKRCAESICMDFHRQYGLPVKIIRIFNTYGPNMAADDGRVVSNFIVQALQGKPLTIYGDGSQTRSFQYIDDLIRGIQLMMQTSDDFTGPVNLGNPEEYTVKELAEKILRLTDSPSTLVYHPLPQDDPSQRCPDISLAKKMLDWEPKVGVIEGLKKTITYFDNNI